MTTLHWSPSTRDDAPSAVALVVHGLNFRPDRMQPLIDGLTGAGVDCLSLSLHGHGDNFVRGNGMNDSNLLAARAASYRRVTPGLWLDELVAAHAIARTRADLLQAPLLLCGYSLGALTGCLAMANHPNVQFERMILFAPSLSVPRQRLISCLVRRVPRLILPSLAPTYYQANQATPASVYAALFDAVDLLRCSDLQRLNVPTLLFVDEGDELVSFDGVKDIAEQLSNWQLKPIHKSAPAAGVVYHHLVIGQAAVGAQTWAQIVERIKGFVRPSNSDDGSTLPSKV